MSEQPQHNDFSPPASAEQDMVVLIKKMHQQLLFLEKKIDILINQSQARPFGEKHFSKPFRSFDRPHRRPGREYGHGSAEKGLDRERHFEKRHGEESRGFAQKKGPFFHKRRDRG